MRHNRVCVKETLEFLLAYFKARNIRYSENDRYQIFCFRNCQLFFANVNFFNFVFCYIGLSIYTTSNCTTNNSYINSDLT